MMEQEFEFIEGTETIPPQIRNEHLATKLQGQSAYAALNDWEEEHDLSLTPLPPEFED
jgi:hypothetical protein